ncbi:hypothetical protein BVI2075_230155 [Burkholderia vietnamiensis]|nr:hypothetical protein BVI2075_230155 [Burkholderia vietnamiensis]CAG9228296.1 hypothetical protein BVI1335_70011 [Burkholderia vietnamiensis]
MRSLALRARRNVDVGQVARVRELFYWWTRCAHLTYRKSYV